MPTARPYGLAVYETAPSVNPAQIYAVGYQLVANNERAFVDKLIEDVPAACHRRRPLKEPPSGIAASVTRMAGVFPHRMGPR
jgi:hypothetical protein